jgi:hypothetical protein
MQTIFENIQMAILAKKYLKDFISEQYKHNTIPFCVISDEKRVGKYLEMLNNGKATGQEEEPQVIVLVFDYEKKKINC